LGLVAACLLPREFAVQAFSEILDGMSAACQDARTHLVGGDTKEGAELRVITTAIGVCPVKSVISRGGARAGDVLFVTGPIGTTLSNYTAIRRCAGKGDVHRPCAGAEIGRML